MKILVKRIGSDSDATLSEIYIDGVFFCHGLEDEYRAEKIAHETRIPAGIYKLNCKQSGGFYERYKKRFPKFFDGSLEVLDVPGFSHILIHCGNTDDDSSGCLLVGEYNADAFGLTLKNSGVTFEKFYKKIIALTKLGQNTIEYQDHDR